ncbi:MAG TPA: hypothetical protein VFO39_16415 [Candidatus Sulfotelmatobacter sp.]|nr:hypothetical protein [Candidatus Sulfotelmatobacter sp.]
MRLLRLADVPLKPEDQVYSHTRVRGLVITLVGVACFAVPLYAALTHGWRLGYYIASCILLGLALMRRYVSARFRPSNWLLRTTDTGIFIQFRSYLNFHLPANDTTVVFISFGEIQSARLVRERVRVSTSGGRPSTQIQRYVELELAGDTKPLADALQAELNEHAPNEKRWYGSTSTLYEDHPVRMRVPPYLQVCWSGVSGAKNFLAALRPYAPIADPVLIDQDFTNLQRLEPGEQERCLRDLVQKGEMIAAIYSARQVYGCGLTEAKQMVERLRAEPSVRA